MSEKGNDIFSGPNNQLHRTLPYLPYSWTLTCPCCGQTKISFEKKNTIPLLMLKKYMKDMFVVTPFVFNILYHMCHDESLEEEYAKMWPEKILLMHRGKVTFCCSCVRLIHERIKPLGMVANIIEKEEKDEAKEEDEVDEEMDEDKEINEDKEMDEDKVSSLDEFYDVWVLSKSIRVGLGEYDGKYVSEPGRDGTKNFKTMIPMDNVLQMVLSPNLKMVPAYRMLTRVLNTLVCGGLYCHLPILPLRTLINQIKNGDIDLNGQNGMTIADRVHLSAFSSGGKRRLVKQNIQYARVARRCLHAIMLAAYNSREMQGVALDEVFYTG
jgi:hypothetical protein